jgi:hypothetical protein
MVGKTTIKLAGMGKGGTIGMVVDNKPLSSLFLV